MEIRDYTPEDFSVVQKWFKDWNWEACEPQSIGKNAYFVLQDGEPIAFSFFVESDTNICWLGFTIVKKGLSRELQENSLDSLMLYIFKKAKEAGYKYVWYASACEAMVKRLQKLNLMQVTESASAYILAGDLTNTVNKLSDMF